MKITDFDGRSALAAVLILFNFISGCSNSQTPAGHVETGKRWFERGDNDVAISEFSRAIKLDPRFAEAFYQRGVAFMQKKEYAIAASDFDEAIRLKPGYVEALKFRAHCHTSQRKYSESISDYTTLIDITADDWEFLMERGDVYLAQAEMPGMKQSYHSAIADYDRALQLDQSNMKPVAHRAIAFEGLGEHAKAMAEIDRSMASDPEYAEAHFVRGIILSSRGEEQPAIDSFNQAIKWRPNYAQAYQQRGHSYVKLNNADQAAADFRRAKEYGFEE